LENSPLNLKRIPKKIHFLAERLMKDDQILPYYVLKENIKDSDKRKILEKNSLK